MRSFTVLFVQSLLFIMTLAAPARPEVLVRWKRGAIPSRDALGVAALVATAGSAISREAAEKNYRVVEGDGALAADDTGKWPRIRGNVRMRDGRPVQAASRTAQPWIDNNVALIRLRQATGRRPVLGYAWQPATQADSQVVPSADDYCLAIAEAGAFGADLVLELDEAALPTWKEARPYLEYYARKRAGVVAANVGVMTRDPAAWYEVLNLMARHNVPYRILPPSGPYPTEDMDLTIVTEGTHAPPGVAPERLLRAGDDASDPNSFALKVWNALGRKRRLVDIWNGITVLTGLERIEERSLRLELVNYSARSLPIQVRVKGTYRSVEYTRPEAPSQTLPAEHLDGFTEFVVPELRIGGTVSIRP